MALSEGTRVFICYDLPPPALWHERHVLARCACGQGWHIIYTPDGDVYPEQISLENHDIAGFRIGSEGNLPYGLTDANAYRIRSLPLAPEMAQIRVDAQHAAAAMGAIPGVAQVAAPLGAVVAHQAVNGDVGNQAVPDESHKWVIVESEGIRRRGDEVTLDGTEVIRGDVGLKSGSDVVLHPPIEGGGHAEISWPGGLCRCPIDERDLPRAWSQ